MEHPLTEPLTFQIYSSSLIAQVKGVFLQLSHEFQSRAKVSKFEIGHILTNTQLIFIFPVSLGPFSSSEQNESLQSALQGRAFKLFAKLVLAGNSNSWHSCENTPLKKSFLA